MNYGHFCETDLYAVYMTAHVHVACDTHVQSDYSMTAVISIFPFHHPTAPLTSVRKSILSRWSRSFKWPTHYDAIKIEQCVTAVSTYSMARLNHPYIHFHLSFRSVKVKAISQKDCSWPLRYSLRIFFISNSLFPPPLPLAFVIALNTLSSSSLTTDSLTPELFSGISCWWERPWLRYSLLWSQLWLISIHCQCSSGPLLSLLGHIYTQLKRHWPNKQALS